MTQQERAREAILFARFKQQQLLEEQRKRRQELGNNLDAPAVAKPKIPTTQTGEAVSGLVSAVGDSVKETASNLNPIPPIVTKAKNVDQRVADAIKNLTAPTEIPQGSQNLTVVSTPKGKLRKTQAQVDAENRALVQSRRNNLNITPRGGTSIRINRPTPAPLPTATSGFGDLVTSTPLDDVETRGQLTFDDFNRGYDDFPGGAEPPTNQTPDASIRQRALNAGTIDASNLPDQSLFTGVPKAEVEKVPIMQSIKNRFSRGRNRDPQKAVTLDNPLPKGADAGGKTKVGVQFFPDEIKAIEESPYGPKSSLNTLRKTGRLLTPFADPIGFMADMKTLSEASDAERGVIGYEPRPAEFIPTNRMVPDAPRNAPRREGTFRMQPEMIPNPERRSDFDYFRFGPKPIYSPEAELYRQGT